MTGVFSGGSGDSNALPQTPMNAETTAQMNDLLNLLNSRAAQHYMIDPDGMKVELLFWPTGIVGVKSGDAPAIQLPYKRL